MVDGTQHITQQYQNIALNKNNMCIVKTHPRKFVIVLCTHDNK